MSKSDRNRAIDIYENLNIGGISLSTFELVLAKGAKRSLQVIRIFFDLIVDDIQRTKKYDEKIVPDRMKKYYKCFIDTIGMYSASDELGCFDEKKNQLNKKYTDIFFECIVSDLLCS